VRATRFILRGKSGLVAKSLINLPAVAADFEHRQERVFSPTDLVSTFNSGRFDWNLPRSMDPRTFVQMLLRRTKMTQVSLTSSEYPPLLRYVWGTDVAPVLLALSIKPNAFCSHGSAMWIHGLGGDEDHIYVNSEQSEKPPNRSTLAQDAIDRAFRSEQRKSKLVYKYRGATIVVLNGKNSGRLEVEPAKAPSGERVEVTSLERTLVDIVVRPVYAGGIPRVLESFRIARGRASVDKLLRILQSLDYVYPYHQSVGLYLKRSAYPEVDLDLVRKLGTRFNFYLGHGMKDSALDEEFKVFYPKSLK
jgi:hypothetical protein